MQAVICSSSFANAILLECSVRRTPLAAGQAPTDEQQRGPQPQTVRSSSASIGRQVRAEAAFNLSAVQPG